MTFQRSTFNLYVRERLLKPIERQQERAIRELTHTHTHTPALVD